MVSQMDFVKDGAVRMYHSQPNYASIVNWLANAMDDYSALDLHAAVMLAREKHIEKKLVQSQQRYKTRGELHFEQGVGGGDGV